MNLLCKKNIKQGSNLWFCGGNDYVTISPDIQGLNTEVVPQWKTIGRGQFFQMDVVRLHQSQMHLPTCRLCLHVSWETTSCQWNTTHLWSYSLFWFIQHIEQLITKREYSLRCTKTPESINMREYILYPDVSEIASPNTQTGSRSSATYVGKAGRALPSLRFKIP